MSEKLHQYEEYDESVRPAGRNRVRWTLNRKHIPKKQVGKRADRFSKHKKNIEGDVCRVDGRQYLITERDDVYNFETGQKITDPDLIIRVIGADDDCVRQRQDEAGYDELNYLLDMEEDGYIEKHVDEVAKALHEADPVTREILCWHLEYEHGQIRSVEKKGITFYQVGHNASHEFYAGAKEGRKYKYTVGEDYDEEGNFCPDEQIYEVEEWGYMGHF